MRLIHLTDPHLSKLDDEKFWQLRGKRWSGYLSWRKNRRKRYLPAILDRLTEAVKAECADKILLTGDLIQIGLETEIAQATAWLDTLGTPEEVMLVPGNHDVYANGSEAAVHKAWSRYLFQGREPDSTLERVTFPVLSKHGNISFIGLSTACVTPVFMASGKLGDEQLTRLAGLLQQAADEKQSVCLLIHHPPLPGMTSRRKALADAEALRLVLEANPPLLVFHGHLHHNREQQWGDSRIYCTAAASSAGDASFRIIDIEDRGDYLEFHMRLKSLAIEDTGGLGFVTVDDQRWQVPRNT